MASKQTTEHSSKDFILSQNRIYESVRDKLTEEEKFAFTFCILRDLLISVGRTTFRGLLPIDLDYITSQWLGLLALNNLFYELRQPKPSLDQVLKDLKNMDNAEYLGDL
jgi:hypothetical protein